jgi:hypothetical protein
MPKSSEWAIQNDVERREAKLLIGQDEAHRMRVE